MRLPARKNHRHGFTLIEVVVSIGVFSLILVGGFIAATSLLNSQRIVYQRTVGASLISLIAQSRFIQFQTAIYGTSTGTTPPTSILTPLTTHKPNTSNPDVFVGGNNTDYNSNKWYVVNTTGADSSSGYDLKAYKNIAVMQGATTDTSTSANFKAWYTFYSLWAINPEEFDESLSPTPVKNRRLVFLGRYAMPDGFE